MDPARIPQLLPLPALVVGADRLVLGANAALAELLGEAAPGRHFLTLVRHPDLVEAIEAALDEGRGASARASLGAGGAAQEFRVTASPLAVAGAGRGGALVVFEDVTPLEAARRLRSDFVANVSHELRTPLAALAGLVETLRGPAREDAPARERFLEIMGREVVRMERLVSDLLSLAHVEARERQRPGEAVSLGPILEEVVTTLAPLARQRRVRLDLDVSAPAPRVPGEAEALRQVFLNLVENAVKYGREGGRVTIRLRREGACLAVDVSDEGEGIAEHHLGRLTERFYRVDTHRSREVGGTGLGLAIVKHILNRHRGRLRVRSRLGQGSTFTAILPVFDAGTAEHDREDHR